MKPFILRRMKSGVLTELPEKTETVLLSEMEKEQGGIYSANVAEVRSAVSASDGGNTEKNKDPRNADQAAADMLRPGAGLR